jgi:hypothetical protein
MSSSSTPSKRTWHDTLFGGYITASTAISAKFNGVTNIELSVATSSPALATASKLFRLTLPRHLPHHKYCLLPIDEPGSGDAWDSTFLSTADMLVWKFVVDLSDSGGGMLFELAGTLCEAQLSVGLCVSPDCTKIRLDPVPPMSLVGVKDQAVSTAAVKLVSATQEAPSSTGTSGKDPGVTHKSAGVVVTDLNGDTRTFRTKAHSAERIILTAGPLRESNSARLTQLMVDLDFTAADFKDQCQRHAYRNIEVGDKLHSLPRIREVDELSA